VFADWKTNLTYADEADLSHLQAPCSLRPRHCSLSFLFGFEEFKRRDDLDAAEWSRDYDCRE
jgi:hypothetical protein